MTGSFWMAGHAQGWCREISDEMEIGIEPENLKDFPEIFKEEE